ncbi:unnamed protein product [Chilo suppressalis]|uniref:Thioredoxin-like protein n=1 Tax=Chilo suppressalis TaxID=168631 RepID=A0ABN8AVZ9_CHISP|nr:unnamed protein product [Chilo suppressalis]
MSYMLGHLHNGWQVDQAILSEEDRVVVIRFGHDWDPTCMKMDEVLYSIAEKVKNFAVIYLVDITEVPDFNKMYELYDPCTVMFFFRNKHIMIDLGTGNNNKINWPLEDKQEMIDIIETVYRGARKGRGLVVSPKDYSTKYRDSMVTHYKTTKRDDEDQHYWVSGNLKRSIKETVVNSLEGMFKIIKDMEKQGNSLQGKSKEEIEPNNDKILQEVKAIKKILLEDRKTYAEIAAISKEPKFQAPKQVAPIRNTDPTHSLIISSEDTKDTSEVVLTKIRTAVDAKNSGLHVEMVRKAKNQKVVLSCSSKDEIEMITKRIEEGCKELKVEVAKNKDPLVIIKNVLSYHSDEEVINALKRQNKNVLQHIPAEESRMEIRYRRKARNPLENHIVLQVSPKIWQNLTSTGLVFVDLQKCVVEDQSPLVQ